MEGPKAALVASKDFKDGHYDETPQFGIRAFARVYCAWAYGQTVRFFFTSSYVIPWIHKSIILPVVPGTQIPMGWPVGTCWVKVYLDHMVYG